MSEKNMLQTDMSRLQKHWMEAKANWHLHVSETNDLDGFAHKVWTELQLQN